MNDPLAVAHAAPHAADVTGSPPIWTIAPFALYLLLIAVIPLVAGGFWAKNRNKLLVAAILSVPVVGYLGLGPPHGLVWLAESVKEYVAFMTLLLALFVITGGIHLRGELDGTPLVNTAFLALGAVAANLIGTTGASLLLIRPLLRANQGRARRVHMVVFFIFIVSNGAGLLTPLGDPPLFLGFLRGVPFFWALRLLGPWALVNGTLLLTFYILDATMLKREGRARPASRRRTEPPAATGEPLRIAGGLNFVWLLGVIVVVYVSGAYGHAITDNAYLLTLLQVAGLLAMAGLSFRLTPREVHQANGFGWAPIIEVAAVFVGIFVTMVPALRVLAAQGAGLGVTRPWQFFWASGGLSSFLDNAPTYLTFATLAVGVTNQLSGSQLSASDLASLGSHPLGATLLAAVSCGSVFMGANSYIGNGPNFMVKALAEEGRVRMPSFFGYMAWSVGILVPLFLVVTLVFFR
jgi:Na+/H+ antiporter NhaD/arsenite permease-like protein